MKLNNTKGLTGLELLIEIGLIALLLGVASTTYLFMERSSRGIQIRDKYHKAMIELSFMIQKIGKVAMLCEKKENANNSSLFNLQCKGTFLITGSPTLQWVRFTQRSLQEVVLEQDLDASGQFNPGHTRILMTYSGIQRLEICNDEDFRGGTCAIKPLDLSDFRRQHIRPKKENRVFRLRLENISNDYLQLSFYQRNPTEMNIGSVSYAW